MEPAGSEAPSKGGTKVKQPSPSSQLWVALSILASPRTLPSPSCLNSCLTLDGDGVSVYFVSGCRLVKHLSRVLVPSTQVEDGGFDQSLQLPAMATRWASFLSNGASLRASKMFCSTRSHRRHAPFFRRFHPAETTPPKRAFLYLIAHRRKCSIAAWFSNSRVLSEPESSRFVSTSQLNA